MTARVWVLAATGWLSLLGCRSAGIDGGRTEPPAPRTPGTALAEYALEDCRDSRGDRVEAPQCRVAHVRLATGREALVEERPGYDTLVLERERTRDGQRIFAITLGDGVGGRVLHELSIPMKPGNGRFRLADAFEGEAGDAEEPLMASAIALDCALVPRVSGRALDTSEALE